MTDYEVKETAVIYTDAPDQNVIDVYDMRFIGAPEKANLYIQFDDWKSMNIEKISLDRVNDDMAKGVFADTGRIVSGSAALSEIPEGEIHRIINKTSGAVIEFTDVEIKDDANEFFARMCGSGANKGQPVQLRVGSPDGEVYGTFTSASNSWFDYGLEYVKLDKTLPAGTYDIYLTFTGSKTSNFLWFGLGWNDEYTKTDEEIAEEVTEETVIEETTQETAE